MRDLARIRTVVAASPVAESCPARPDERQALFLASLVVLHGDELREDADGITVWRSGEERPWMIYSTPRPTEMMRRVGSRRASRRGRSDRRSSAVEQSVARHPHTVEAAGSSPARAIV
jgi:hypothetical protein